MLNLVQLTTCTVTTVISQDWQEPLNFSLHPVTLFTCPNLIWAFPPQPLSHLFCLRANSLRSLTHLKLDEISPQSSSCLNPQHLPSLTLLTHTGFLPVREHCLSLALDLLFPMPGTSLTQVSTSSLQVSAPAMSGEVPPDLYLK